MHHPTKKSPCILQFQIHLLDICTSFHSHHLKPLPDTKTCYPDLTTEDMKENIFHIKLSTLDRMFYNLWNNYLTFAYSIQEKDKHSL